MNATSSKRVKVATVLLSGLAVALAGLLLYQSQTHQALPGCDGGSGCDTVLSSKWSLWFGVPVSLLAMGLYATMFSAALAYDTKRNNPQSAVTWTMAVTAFAAVAAALWFISIQVFAIGALCKYCMATHTIGIAASALCLMIALPTLQTKALASTAAASLLLVGVMVAGQFLGEPPPAPDAIIKFADNMGNDTGINDALPDAYDPLPIEPLPALEPTPPDPKPTAENINTPTAIISPSNPDTPEPTGPRIIRLNGNRIEIDTTIVPIIGDPNAPIIIAILYDYTCSHCRDTRKMLEKTKRKYGDQLAILCLPTPLNSRCNRLVKRYSSHNRYSCDLAKISLALWKIAPDKWAQFDKQLYSNEELLTPARARIAAGKLVKDKDLVKAMKDPWVDQQIARDVNMYANTAKATGSTAIPMIVSQYGAMNGTPQHPLDIDDLIKGKKSN
jgi:uncharacterized membrane protein